jgi:hypothetical protein
MLSTLLLLGMALSAMGGYIPPGPRFRCPKDAIYIYPCTCLRGSDRGLYIRCENTNLASLSLAFTNLGNEGMPIEELVLYKCNIGEQQIWSCVGKAEHDIYGIKTFWRNKTDE